MADSKKYNGSIWQHSLRKLGTDTDTLTNLPAVLYPTGATATVGLKGQTTQSSIPSPVSPVMPEGTGERTGNLFDKTTLENGIYLAANGNKYGDVTNGVCAGVKIKVLPNTAYTLSAQSSAKVSLRFLEWSNGTFTTQTPKYSISGNISLTVTTDTETTEIAFNIEGANGQYVTNIMLNTGSTPLPYEPYGYKIQISSANTTTPVYLGEVETTRKIYKWVLTGNEAGWFYANGFVYNQSITPDYLRSAAQTVVCSHFKAIPNVKAGGNVGEGECALYSIVGVQRLYFRDSNYTTSVTDFKTYLAQQYAAGTPVTVWYVLATEETGIVNEPIRKIGDYADEVSGISIPTITGKDSFDVLTTLKPSEVSLAYTGWHDASAKEWDGSEWQ